MKHKGFYEHPEYPWIGGSPDGLIGDRGLIEVKCPFVNKICHTKIPPVYYCQMNGLMEILDKDWCDYITWTPTEMKVYRVYRDKELWDFLLDRYSTFYAYMQRGCDQMPKMTAAEKAEVLARIEASDQQTDYTFWAATEPGHLKGRWEGPPTDPFSEESSSDSPSSKRSREDDVASEVGKLPKSEESAAVHDPAGCGDVHSVPEADVPE